MPKRSFLHRAAIFEALESRRLLASFTILGSPGDDHIVFSFDSVTRDVTVTGASNYADGAIFPAGTHQDSLAFSIDTGDGDDKVEMGLEKIGYDHPMAWGNMFGGAGDDTLIGGNGDDHFDGGAGNDTIIGDSDMIQFSAPTHGVNLDLENGIVYDDGQGGTDQISGINSVYGTWFDDKMIGGGVNSGWFNGLGGNDLLVVSKTASSNSYFALYGGDGDDTLIGGPGDDTIDPGAGTDRAFGGGGNNVLKYFNDNAPTHGTLIRLDRGVVENDGYGGRDIIKNFRNVDVYSFLNDTIYGDAYDNEINSNMGVDLIYGGDGNDQLSLDSGIILGGFGDDMLEASKPVVLLKGGPGTDQVTLTGPRYSVARILLGVGDTLNDYRWKPSPNNPAPTNDLQLPPLKLNPSHTPGTPTPKPKPDWFLHPWDLE